MSAPSMHDTGTQAVTESRAASARIATLAFAMLWLVACSAQPRPDRPANAPVPATGRTAPAAPASPTHAAPIEPAPPVTAPIPQRAPTGDAASHLARALDAFIAQPRFRHARWGIAIRDLDSGRMLYSRDAGKLFIPASNAKLYTAALALDTLGPAFRFHTSLYAGTHPDARGVVHGDLVLVGRGDPSLGTDLTDAGATPDDAWADQLAATLAQRGVRRVAGDLIADDTWYAGPPYGAGWERDDALGGYAPPVTALSVHENAFDLRIGGNGTCCTLTTDPAEAGITLVNRLHRATDGMYDPLGLYRAPGTNRLYVIGSRPPTIQPRVFSLATPNPARLAGTTLAAALARHGIRLDGRVRTRHWPDAPVTDGDRHMLRITDVRSPPLRVLVRHMLKDSDNLYAQLLLLAVGKQQAATGTCADRAHPPMLTAGWGLCAMRAWLREIGIGTASAQIEEGSGLSRKDRVTPAATARLLDWITRQPFGDDLRAALPVAGVDGTLQHRLRDAPLAGNLRAKTGTLHLAYTLSGYLHAANGARLVFSIMLNGYAAPQDPDTGKVYVSPARELDDVASIVAAYGQVPLAPAPASSSSAVSRRSPDASADKETTPAHRDGPPA